MNNIMKIIEALENSAIFLKGVKKKQSKMKLKNKDEDF